MIQYGTCCDRLYIVVQGVGLYSWSVYLTSLNMFSQINGYFKLQTPTFSLKFNHYFGKKHGLFKYMHNATKTGQATANIGEFNNQI